MSVKGRQDIRLLCHMSTLQQLHYFEDTSYTSVLFENPHLKAKGTDVQHMRSKPTNFEVKLKSTDLCSILDNPFTVTSECAVGLLYT